MCWDWAQTVWLTARMKRKSTAVEFQDVTRYNSDNMHHLKEHFPLQMQKLMVINTLQYKLFSDILIMLHCTL